MYGVEKLRKAMASMNEKIWENDIKMYLWNYINLAYIPAKHNLNIFRLL